MDLRLKVRRINNLLVCLVFDLGARRFELLGKNRFGAGAVENELSTVVSSRTCSNIQRKTHQIAQIRHF